MYWLQRRVHTLSAVSLSENVDVVRGQVKGSRPHAYKVEICIYHREDQSPDFVSECSCPVKHQCKHTAALMFELLHGGDNLYRQFDSDNPDDKALAKRWMSYSMQSNKQIRPASRTTLIPAINPPAPAPEMKPALQNWLETLNQAVRVPQGNHYPAEVRHRLLYLLQTWQTDSHLYLIVRIGYCRVLKNGEYGAFRAVRTDQRPDYLRPIDRQLLEQMTRLSAQRARPDNSSFLLHGESVADVLSRLLESGRCHWQDKDNPPLQAGSPVAAQVGWQISENGQQSLQYQLPLADYQVLPLLPLHYVDVQNHVCGILESELPAAVMLALLDAPRLAPADVAQLSEMLAQQFPDLPRPRHFNIIEQHKTRPVPHLRLLNGHFRANPCYTWFYGRKKQVELPVARLSFIYDGLRVSDHHQPDRMLHHFDTDTQQMYHIHRHPHLENQLHRRLEAAGFERLHRHHRHRYLEIPETHLEDWFLCSREPVKDNTYNEQDLINFSLYEVPRLRKEGWQIEMDEDYLFRIIDPALAEEWYADVKDSSGIDWFGLELGIIIDNEKVRLLPLLLNMLHTLPSMRELSALAEMPPETLLTLRMDDGRLLPLPVGRVIDILQVLLELLDQGTELDEDGRLQMARLKAVQLADLEAAMRSVRMRWLGGEQLLILGRKLQQFTQIEAVPVPDDFQATLRPYQQAGVNWLQFLREYGLGGVLADDMGLGKTVQTLAHILIEKQSGRMQHPCLVVAPTSLITNWRQEAERFTPALKVLVLQGPTRNERFEQMAAHDLLLTTYALLPRDQKSLLAQPFHLLILDEAQHIKNPEARSTNIVQQLQAQHRLCLSGTPMENHLGELWSIFHFLMPGLLGDPRSFRHLFRLPIERASDPERQQILQRRIKPFMLRRTKQAVISELPEKTEIVRTVSLEGAQQDLYEAIRLTMHDKVRHEIAAKGMARSQIIILDALLKLRQVCCDPRLLKLNAAEGVTQSAKLMLLMELLPEMVAEGRRILLFSQFTSMLTLIEAELKKHQIDYSKLTGQTRKRSKAIEQFQTGEVPVFLISLKAGGTGLNLTTADTVIHYDPWWNPAVENQATDRAHRIGQDKRVFVYRLLTEGTVEEKIQALQARKQALAKSMLDEEKQRGAESLTQDDLTTLFELLE